MDRRADTVQVIVVMAVFFSLLVAASVWWERRKAASARHAKPIPGEKPAAPVMIRNGYILAFLAVLILVWSLAPRRPGLHPGPQRPPGPGRPWLLLVFLVPVALVLIPLAISLIRSYRMADRAMMRALEKANAGDKDGALVDIQAEIQAKGLNAARAAALGALHCLRREWDDAAGMYREAERLGFDRAICQMNQAVILNGSGRPQDAVPVLEELFARTPDNPVLGCNLCTILIDLGRTDEARAVLADVENRRKKTILLGARHREAIDRLIGECRERLDGKPKPEGFGFDEL